ncbi:MAG: hypothetical protein OXF20_01350 [Gammaproteobacteria bacterium]|nr:hypothetical protein [Gammaproteobacteria bacterium]
MKKTLSKQSVGDERTTAGLVVHMLAGGLLTAIYTVMALYSNLDTGMPVSVFVQTYTLAAMVVAVTYVLQTLGNLTISFRMVFIWAVIFRMIAIFGSPILEDDFHRYLLDGCVFVATGSPYGVAPSSLFAGSDLSPECQATLNWVNNPDLPTIYGPVLQYVFALAHLASPADINFLQVLLAGVDLVLIWMLTKVAPLRYVMLYAWCPLIIKETVFTAHPDVIGATLLFAAFLLRSRSQSMLAVLAATLACCAKVFALIALPYFLFRKGFKHWALASLVAFLLYIPFVLQGNTDMLVLGIFVKEWNFNPLVFEALRAFFSDRSARFICLSLFVALWTYYFYWFHRQNHDRSNTIPRMDWIFGVFLALSPVINAWYLVWLLPFAVLRPTFVAWAASFAVVFSYVNGLNLMSANLAAYEVYDPAYTLEVLIIAAAFLTDLAFNRSGMAGGTVRLARCQNQP